MPDFTDTSAPLQDRARAYLASNCSMCHRPAGPTPAMFDVRWETTNDAMNAIDKTPTRGNLGITGARIIAPGDPGRSILLQRMHRLDGARMPPLATSRVDEVGTQLIAEWITSLGAPANAELWMAY